MSIENLKRWHWVLIGLFLGLLVAFSQIQIGLDGMFASGEHRTIGQLDFERGIHHAPIRDYPIIKDLIVYPDGKRFVLRMKRAEPHPRFPGDKLGYHYVEYSLVASRPYLPVTDLKKTVEVVIIPAERAVHVNMNAGRSGVASKLSGWPAGSGRSSDPGSGAKVEMALRPANYLLTVLVEQPTGMDQLAVKLNAVRLPGFTQARGGNPMLWQTSIPRSAFTSDARQTLEFSRTSNPILIREIRLFDPSYTVVDYLNEAGPDAKPVAYRFGWWTRPMAVLCLWTVGGVVMIGGVWPTILNLLIGAGFGRPHVEKQENDRDQSKGQEPGAEPQLVNAAAGGELEEKLLAEMSQAPAAPVDPAPPALRVLSNEPIQPQTASEDPPEEQSPRTYQGEFYPVVRPPAERNEGSPGKPD